MRVFHDDQDLRVLSFKQNLVKLDNLDQNHLTHLALYQQTVQQFFFSYPFFEFGTFYKLYLISQVSIEHISIVLS